MDITCTNCGHSEKTDTDFFVKLIGGAMPVGGFWAWTTYLFAGTGFAMAIVVAIIGGGVAMLMFKDEIVEWIIDKDYKCSECGNVKWTADTEVEKEKKRVGASSILEFTPEQRRSNPKVAALFENIPTLDIEIPTLDKIKESGQLNKRIKIAENLLLAKGYDSVKVETSWIILAPSKEWKKIEDIDELEQFALSLDFDAQNEIED